MAATAEARSPFYTTVKDTYGWHLGEEVASRAEDNLRRWGIDPAELKLETGGHNVRLFSLNNQLAIKVTTELETHMQTPLGPNPLVVGRLRSANLAYDQGGVPINLEITPFMNTRGVEPHHVRALCHEMYTKYGLLFRDNKPDNVGLSRDGTPYIIDAGSLTPVTSLSPMEAPFIYPVNSGFNAASKSWDAGASGHTFHWPASPQDVPEYRDAAALLAQRQEALARAGAAKTT